MTKTIGITGSVGAGSYDTALLQTATELMSTDVAFDIAGGKGISPHGAEFRAEENMPAASNAAPFSRILVVNRFEHLSVSHLKDWDRLALQIQNKMPFQTVNWNRTWWSHFQRRGIFIKDELHLVCAMRDDRLIGIVPLFKTTMGFPGFPIVRYLRLLGADRNLTEWRSVICRDEDRKALHALWVKEAIKLKFGFCLFHFRGFTDEEVADAQLEKIGFVKILTPHNENFVLALADNWDAFKTKLKRNIKESLRHCYNSLKHADLKLSMTVVDDADTLCAKLPLFYRWHALRANNKETVTHPDYFKKPEHKQFLESLANALCPQGQMKLFELKLNDQPAAYRLGFVTGDTLYLYFSAYDPEFSKFSVMTTLVAEMIKWAIDQKIKFVNLSFGRDNSKIRWGPAVFHSCDALVGPRGIWLLDTYRELFGSGRSLMASIKRRYWVSDKPA